MPPKVTVVLENGWWRRRMTRKKAQHQKRGKGKSFKMPKNLLSRIGLDTFFPGQVRYLKKQLEKQIWKSDLAPYPMDMRSTSNDCTNLMPTFPGSTRGRRGWWALLCQHVHWTCLVYFAASCCAFSCLFFCLLVSMFIVVWSVYSFYYFIVLFRSL